MSLPAPLLPHTCCLPLCRLASPFSSLVITHALLPPSYPPSPLSPSQTTTTPPPSLLTLPPSDFSVPLPLKLGLLFILLSIKPQVKRKRRLPLMEHKQVLYSRDGIHCAPHEGTLREILTERGYRRCSRPFSSYSSRHKRKAGGAGRLMMKCCFT